MPDKHQFGARQALCIAMEVLGFDIGGSAIKSAVVNTIDGGLLREPHSVLLPQPANPAGLTDAIQTIIAENDWPGPIGIGFPGVVKNGRIYMAAHLHDSFLDTDWLASLKQLTDAPIALLNDADAAGIAEMRFGAGAAATTPSKSTVLLVTLGTGIGTALFHDGFLFPNTEFGHMQLGESEAEDLAAAAVRISGKLSWEQYGDRVSQFLAEMERLLSPDLIIIGGGICENFDKFGAHLKTRAEVVPAALGNNAGLIGAALAAADK